MGTMLEVTWEGGGGGLPKKNQFRNGVWSACVQHPLLALQITAKNEQFPKLHTMLGGQPIPYTD